MSTERHIGIVWTNYTLKTVQTYSCAVYIYFLYEKFIYLPGGGVGVVSVVPDGVVVGGPEHRKHSKS